MKAQLFRGELHYTGVTLHTAASGPVTALDTVWLRLEDQGVTGLAKYGSIFATCMAIAKSRC